VAAFRQNDFHSLADKFATKSSIPARTNSGLSPIAQAGVDENVLQERFAFELLLRIEHAGFFEQAFQ
jgi:hypothetical protein